MDELPGATTAKDATAQLADGTLVDTGGSWQPRGGYDGGGALALTGNARLDIPLNWQPATFSFSFWLKPTRLYNYGQLTGAKARWGAFLFHSADNGQLYVGTDGDNRIVTQAGTVQVGVWQHFVFTFANGVGTIYKNGKLLSSQSGMAPSLPWQGLSLGYNGGEAVYDEIRVYNRVISAQETAGLFGHYEAEEIPAAQLVKATIGSSNGVTYAENLTQSSSSTQVGSTVPFTVSVPEAGIYTITARYATTAEYVRTLSVYVNGLDVTQAQFPATGSAASWSTQNVKVALQQGSNTIAYRYDADDNGQVNIDYLDVNSSISPGYINGSAATSTLPAEVGVDKFTGTATVNAPLYTVTIPGFSLPLALHYSAGGVQVDDTGGEIGLNWSLQAGPSIHRQVRDLPDDSKLETSATPERRYGWLRYPTGTPATRLAAVPNAPTTFNATCTTGEQTAFTQLNSLGSLNHGAGATTLYDTEPDIFTYSIPGYAGKFIFDETGAVRLMPYAPIQITPVFATGTALAGSCTYAVPVGELAGFTIRTAEGVLYEFNDLARISQQTQTSAPYGGSKYLLRQFRDFKIRQDESGSYMGPTNTDYTTGWLATQITTPVARINPTVKAANRISFTYDCSPHIPVPETQSTLFLVGNSTNLPTPDHTLVTRVLTSPQLTKITTATTVVTFARELDVSDNYHLTSLAITSPLEQGGLLKSYTFEYLGAGRYLRKVFLNRPTSTLPLYDFTYAPETGTTPPAAAKVATGVNINKDYWGFANNNKVRTGIPQLYVYPQLLSGTALRPAAPYRLYPAAPYQNGGLVLVGADRRPASRLGTAVAGTLTQVTFATGGQVQLEYEQNQFYDPVAQQSLPAGGLRIRTIKVQDPVTQVESRRDYSYQESAGTSTGISSGVLLHLPRFAFVMPLTTSTQWADVTVRSTEELAPDPFEGRPVGYRQVTELIPGKGQVTTVFSVPGGADEVLSAANADSNLPEWRRPVFGVARQPGSGTCPNLTPLQATSDLYPFAPAPNYDFCRGLPLTVWYRAEPTSGTAPGPVVRQEDYTYQYVNAQPALPAVTGLRYEQLGNLSTPLYAYAKYSLLTDFFYATRQQVSQLPVAGGTTNQTSISYRYTNQGWLAAKIIQGSDNTLGRTRYKYLRDYPLPATATGRALQAMRTRLVTEGISSDLVETISEIRPAGSTGRVAYAGATLQTFTTSTAPDATNNLLTTPTYPYQLRRWLPAQPVSSYDSVRIVNNELYIPAALREASTILAVNANLTPLATRTQAGRQVAATHVGYEGSLPLLQIANATAAEVVFSDFETTDNPYSFKLATGSNPTYSTPVAARTGKAGLLLGAGSALTAFLPVSVAPQYRLIFWAKASSATTITVAIRAGSSTPFTQSRNSATQWQRYEVLLPLATLGNRSDYQLSITVNGPLQLDDVLLLPAEASAASTTYGLAVGKTSETDARGRTMYYEYGPTGDLALVRDPNQAIVHQYQKVLPGRTVTAGISFTTSGTGMENEPLTFTAAAGLNGPLQYKWDFGDGTVTPYSTDSNPGATHVYPLLGRTQGYNVRLYVTSQGIEYLYAQPLTIMTPPLTLTTCTAGVLAVDDCVKGSANEQVDYSCNPSAPRTAGYTTFQVKPSLMGNLTYAWEALDATNPTGQWVRSTTNTATITVYKSSSLRYRCRVTRGEEIVLSEELGIDHFQSSPGCP
ncbi:hypothetical protein GCM10027422_46960 [Hymenobacter arcticus]